MTTSMMRTEKICVLGVLTALFVALSMCLKVPVFDNFYVCLGYIAMYMAMALYGITGGLVVGTLGTSIYCLLISGLRGLPGWLVGNVAISIILGLWILITRDLRHNWKWSALTAAIVILSTAIGMLLFKPITEALLYAQPLWARIVTNFPAFVTDAIVLCGSIPLYKILEPNIPKTVKTEA